MSTLYRHDDDIWIIYLLAFIGACVLMYWSMIEVINTYKMIKRGFRALEYNYLTEDKKVIEPREWKDTSTKESEG